MMEAGLDRPEPDRIRRWAQAARDGDRRAYGNLVEAFQGAVFGLALKITGDAREAEDVAQETFVRAFEALTRFDPERPFAPWILKIAANLSLSRLRSRRATVPLEDGMAREAGPEETAGRALEGERLRAALARLDPEDRALLALRYHEGMRVGEIARTLGIGEGAAKVRLFRARERLLKELGGSP